MQFLASEVKAVSLSKIKHHISDISTSELIETLASLKRRALIETCHKNQNQNQNQNESETLYCLGYLIKKYISKYNLQAL
ncbi:MAG: hypothetical protein MJK14_28385 [Rivularia sp. ALOHA_DT_140]|nr:hypothetical protein [Rivularia sp. ALOHA_DT_140]